MDENKESINDRIAYLERDIRELRNWAIGHFANPLELIRRLGEAEARIRELEKESNERRNSDKTRQI